MDQNWQFKIIIISFLQVKSPRLFTINCRLLSVGIVAVLNPWVLMWRLSVLCFHFKGQPGNLGVGSGQLVHLGNSLFKILWLTSMVQSVKILRIPFVCIYFVALVQLKDTACQMGNFHSFIYFFSEWQDVISLAHPYNQEPSAELRIKETCLVMYVLSLPGCRQVWQHDPGARPVAGTAGRHCCDSLQTRRSGVGAYTPFNLTLCIEWIFPVLTCAVVVSVSGCGFDLQPASGEAEGPSSLALTAVPGTQWNSGQDPTRHRTG